MKTDLPYEIMVFNIRRELETYIREKKLKSLVLGISGGIDSALCAALARPVCDKLKIPLIGRSIPITTNSTEERDRAEMVGNAFCTNFDEAYQIEGAFGMTWSAIKAEGWDVEDPNEKIRMGNVKARMRMIALYDLAQLHKGLVLSTDNYTEYLLGFWTLHGDVGDYGMVQSLWKTEVYDMAEYIITTLESDSSEEEALQECIDCQATDGLGITGTDLDQILPEWSGSSRDGYAEVDQILKVFMALKDGLPTLKVIKAIDKMIENPVIKRHLATEFKRNHPFNIKRSLILPPLEKEYKKRVRTDIITQKSQATPFKAKDIKDLNLKNGDNIIIHEEEGWHLEIGRERPETDKEFEERIRLEKKRAKSDKEERYREYLDLKKEFEF